MLTRYEHLQSMGGGMVDVTTLMAGSCNLKANFVFVDSRYPDSRFPVSRRQMGIGSTYHTIMLSSYSRRQYVRLPLSSVDRCLWAVIVTSANRWLSRRLIRRLTTVIRARWQQGLFAHAPPLHSVLWPRHKGWIAMLFATMSTSMARNWWLLAAWLCTVLHTVGRLSVGLWLT